MTTNFRTFPPNFYQALEHILEHYWSDERRDLMSVAWHERSLNHISHSLHTLRSELRRTSQPLDLDALLASRRQVAILWSVEDVLSIRPKLTASQAWEVLVRCQQSHDCNYGWTWEFLEAVADDLYPSAGD